MALPRLNELPISTEPPTVTDLRLPEEKITPRRPNPWALATTDSKGETRPGQAPTEPTRPVYITAAMLRQQARPEWLKGYVADVLKAMVPRAASELAMGRTGSGLLSYGSNGPWFAPTWRPGETFDYAASIQYGRQNAIVWACLNAMSNAFPEAPPIVQRMAKDNQETAEPQHKVAQLIRRPNPHMSWPLMASYLIVSLHLDGAAFFWKQREVSGRPMALWPIPPWQITPVWPDGGTTADYIVGYEYHPPGEGDPVFLPASEVVHIRRMIDPENHRLGLNALFPVFRQIFTDEESSAFTAAMLKNLGVPGVILSPKPQAEQAGVRVTAADAMRWKEAFASNFGGERRGEPMVMALPMDVTVASFSPQQLNFEALHRIPETRICAVLNVPPSVANLLAGLEHNTYSNNEQQREAFMEQTMIPLWRLIAEELGRALLGDFERDVTTVRVEFDLAQVRALQEDENALITRVSGALGGPLYTLNEARELAGKPPLPNGDALYIPNTVTLTQITDLIPPEPDPASTEALFPEEETEEEDDDSEGLAATVEALTEGAAWDGEAAFEAKAGDPVSSEVMLKAAYSGEVARLRKSLQDEAQRELEDFFRGQMKRVAMRVLRGQKALGDSLLGPTEIRALRRVLEPLYLKALRSMTGITTRTIRRTVQLEREAEAQFAKEAGAAITGINERTRRAVRRILVQSRAKGWDAARTADELSKLAAFGEARALTIARTEIGTSTNLAAQTVFERSRTVTHVEFFDRESDELCKGWHGKVLPVRAARAVPMLFHPNCSQQRFPVVREEGSE